MGHENHGLAWQWAQTNFDETLHVTEPHPMEGLCKVSESSIPRENILLIAKGKWPERPLLHASM